MFQFPKISNQAENAFERLHQAYQAIQSDLQIRSLLNQKNTLSISAVQKDSVLGVETTKFQHYYNGLEVVGSMAFHHRGPSDVVMQSQVAKFDLSTLPTVDTQTAIALAQAATGNRELKTVPVLKILPASEGNMAKLAYWVDIKAKGANPGREVILDAHTGDLIANISKNESLARVQVFSGKDAATMIDPNTGKTTDGLDANNPDDLEKLKKACQVVDNSSGDPLVLNPSACPHVVVDDQPADGADEAAHRAFDNSKAVLSYYSQVHGRDSFDNKGTDIVNMVHAGIQFDNAFWNVEDNYMAYGDGDGKTLGNFTRALDVAGHEMTHGVTAQTAKLEHMAEAGALNEAYSDFFGKMIANDGDWSIGRKLFLDENHTEGLRDLQDPGRIKISVPKSRQSSEGDVEEIPYPSDMAHRLTTQKACDDSNDNCYVHINCTIPGHASYLVVEAIGKEKAEKLYYLVLTQYLSPMTNFKDAAKATLSACGQIYDGDTCDKVANAFHTVGMI